MKQITQYKYTSLALALTGALCISSFSVNASITDENNEFVMLDGSGGGVGGSTDEVVDMNYTSSPTVTGVVGTWGVSSATPFFGQLWTAHDGVLYGEGTYTIDTIQGDPMTFTVGAGQVGGHILFDWGVTADIDVVNVWDVTQLESPLSDDSAYQYTSTDIDSDGVLGLGMTDGAFVGFNANFNFRNEVPPGLIVSNFSVIQGGVPSNVTTNVGLITIDSGVTGATTYAWTSTPDINALSTNGTDKQTLIIDPTTLTSGTYSVSVAVTKTDFADSAFTKKFQLQAFDLTADSDNDGIKDYVEGTGDTDGDGIPDFLDAIDSSTSLVLTGGSSITTDVGNLTLGSISAARAAQALSDNTDNPGLALGEYVPNVGIAELGGADTFVTSSCVGGCFDFKVTSLTAGATVNIVLPLTAAIPANAVYRKSVNGNWKGFKINANNSLASAPATSTGPTVCPAADSTTYTTGLAVGDFCVRLTMNDGGENDADGQANGTLVDPGGVGTSDQSDLENTSSAIDGVGGGWWFLMGLPALLGLRRFANSK